MSLLLDALNRASKDKAAAAAAEVQPPQQPDSTAQALPVLSLEPQQRPGPGASAMATPDRPELTLTLSEPSAAPSVPRPPDAWATEQQVATPSPIAPEPAPVSVAAPIFTPTPKPGGAPPAVAHAMATSQPAVKPASTAPQAARVAQDIVRAKAAGPRAGPSRRVLALGTVAVLLAAGFGTVLMGWWGDPTAWLQSGGIQGSATSAPPPAAGAAVPGGASVAVGAVTALSDGAQSVTPTPSVASVTNAAPAANPGAFAATQPPVPLARRKATIQSATTDPVVDAGACEPGLDSPGCRPVRVAQSGGQPAQSKAPQPVFQSRSASPSALEQGYLALTQGRLADATQAYGRALTSNPQERDALLGMAYIAQSQGRPDEARSYYQQVLRQEPSNPVARSGLLSLGAVDDREANASRARDVAEQHPDSAAAQATLGHALVRVGRLADAQLAFQRAHLLEPTVAQHAFNLAVALDRLRSYGPARQYYERTLALAAQSGADRAGAVPLAAVRARLNELRADPQATPGQAP